MGTFAARHVWLGNGDWLSPGELVWDRTGRLSALRRARGRVRDVAVFPGLVDAHVHLQLQPMRRTQQPFDRWIRAVMAAGRRAGPDQLGDNAAAALRVLLTSGTTAVGEIDGSGASPPALRAVGFAGRCYQELTGFHLDRAGARLWIAKRRRPGTARCPGGLSPHAPYSVSPALFAAAAAQSRHLSVHTAETPDEQRFLHTGRGALFVLLAELGRLPPAFRPAGVGAVRHLQRLGVLRPSTLLVHCQELERGDHARIAASGAAIAVCPGTIEWFGRSPPPLPQWLRAGIPVALGTDSRASNASMSMLDELRRASHMWPELAPATVLELATVHGARALGRRGLGRLRRGGRADFFCVQTSAAREQTVAELVAGGLAVQATWLGGRLVHGRGRPTLRD